MCFSDVKVLTPAPFCDRNCSTNGMDECEEKFISLYYLVPKGKVLTTEEEILGTGKCVYFAQGAHKHFHISSCDKTMPSFMCQSHSGETSVHNISATWQEANRQCRKAKMTLASFWDQLEPIPESPFWVGFFVSSTPIISPDYHSENNNCPVIWRTHEGNLKLGNDECEVNHRYLCIQDKKRITHNGSSHQVSASQIIGAAVGSFGAVVLIAVVAFVIYRYKVKGRESNKMIFDNRMYQEVMETDPSGYRRAVRNESNHVSHSQGEEKRVSNIYAAYAEITELPFKVDVNPGPTVANRKISEKAHGECIYYASSNITHLTGNTGTVTHQCDLPQTLVKVDTKPFADPEKQTVKEYETIF